MQSSASVRMAEQPLDNPATGRYARGDLAIADSALDHQPVADSGEDCICFAVTDAPLRLTGPVGRIVERLFRRTH